jgi:adenosylcobinamide-GDP ribazoletransferase
VQTLVAAFKYLTVFGLSFAKPAPELIGKSAAFFPLIGLIFGLLLALANYLLAPYLPAEIISVLLIAFLISVTAAQHLYGVRIIFAERGAGEHREGWRTGETFGVAAIVLLILIKSAAVNSMDELTTVSLLLMPVLARWALVIFFYGYGAKFEEIPRLIAAQIKFWPLLVNTTAVLALVMYFLGRKGLWIALAVSILALFLRSILYRRRGALSHGDAHSTVEFSETLALILLASF